MKAEIAYRFPTASLASRFLAELETGAVGRVQSRRHHDDCCVLVIYQLNPSSRFSPVVAELDDLAESLQGKECEI
ncbi:hypothetical protein [Halioxenophilus sp. WMMB6]|uniref:hypothetical protein n=1 Tax=Halioxenophilus sp. WMMB6 TaxID=3073815 RepID=UPI00295E9BBD|nr:hypothetical protein [Halioxenophilus sp. WMMB6]